MGKLSTGFCNCLDNLSNNSNLEEQIETDNSDSFFSNASIEVCGVKTKLSNNINIIKNEKLSLSAFRETFKDVDFKKELSIYNALRDNHPYYNGEIFEKI